MSIRNKLQQDINAFRADIDSMGSSPFNGNGGNLLGNDPRHLGHASASNLLVSEHDLSSPSNLTSAGKTHLEPGLADTFSPDQSIQSQADPSPMEVAAQHGSAWQCGREGKAEHGDPFGTSSVRDLSEADKTQLTSDSIHKIQWGDTLSQIAENKNTTVEALVAENDISDPDLIYAGNILTIPNTEGSLSSTNHTPGSEAIGFGADQNSDFNLPLKEVDKADVAGDFGPRPHPIDGGIKQHNGADLKAKLGDPIFAVAPGTVTYSGEKGGYGKTVEIDHGDGLSTLYAHANELIVESGEKVSPGDEIAKVGSTGKSTGPHLHFETRVNGTPVDPLKHLFPDKSSNTLSNSAHKVQPGETLLDIAQNEGTTVEALVAANKDKVENPNMIIAGDILDLPSDSKSAISLNESTAQIRVQSGNPLSQTEHSNNVTVEALDAADSGQADFAASTGTNDHKYTIHTRSFAPPESFGGGFKGDNRGYSTEIDEEEKEPKVTSRIHSKIHIDTDDQTEITGKNVSANSDPSIHHLLPGGKTEQPVIEILNEDITHNENVTTVKVKTKHSGQDAIGEYLGKPLPGVKNPAPWLDVYTDLTIVDNRDTNELAIDGTLTGDNFPATESFIEDPSGQSIFLGTGAPDSIASPYFSLPDFLAGGKNHIANISLSVATDKEGNFQTVSDGNNEYTIAEWNTKFESQEISFTDPLTDPINGAILELREGVDEIAGEASEANRKIREADGIWNTTGEVLEGAAEIASETREGLLETGKTLGKDTGKTVLKVLDEVKPWDGLVPGF